MTMVVTAPGPNDHGSVTARLGHSSVTARSQLSHGSGHSSVTARSQLNHGEVTPGCDDHGSVTARSQLNHGPGHGSVTAGCDHCGHREQSRWPIFFSWVGSGNGLFRGNGLVLLGNKPLPEPMLTQIYITIYGVTMARLIFVPPAGMA